MPRRGVLRFCELQSKWHAHARYVMRDKIGQRWELASASEFANRTRGKVGRFGVLEVLAQGLRVQGIGRDGLFRAARFMVPPIILQRGNASTIHSAVEAACVDVSHERLVEICRRVPFAWLNEMPDAHSANQQKRAKILQMRESILNCLDVPGTCADHQAHRCIASREPGVIGNVYALGWCGANVRIQQRFQQALRKLVNDDLEAGGWICAPPDASWRSSNESMFRHTLLRDDESLLECGDCEYRHPVHAVRQFLNGDWRIH